MRNDCSLDVLGGAFEIALSAGNTSWRGAHLLRLEVFRFPTLSSFRLTAMQRVFGAHFSFATFENRVFLTAADRGGGQRAFRVRRSDRMAARPVEGYLRGVVDRC